MNGFRQRSMKLFSWRRVPLHAIALCLLLSADVDPSFFYRMSSHSLFKNLIHLFDTFPTGTVKSWNNSEVIWRHIKVKRNIIHAHSYNVCRDTSIIITRIVFNHFSTQLFPGVSWAVIVFNVSRLYIVTINCCHVH